MRMKKLWFKEKSYGWGWQPASWEGWVVLLAYIIACIKTFVFLDRRSHSGSDTLINFAPLFIIYSVILLAICYKTGAKPRWRWGK
jgi:hypothetical protein